MTALVFLVFLSNSYSFTKSDNLRFPVNVRLGVTVQEASGYFGEAEPEGLFRRAACSN